MSDNPRLPVPPSSPDSGRANVLPVEPIEKPPIDSAPPKAAGTSAPPLFPATATTGVLPPQPIRIPPLPPSTDPNYWAKESGELQTQPPQPDPAAQIQDVIIVGGGLSGLTTAFRVLETANLQLGGAKPSVIVLDSAAKLGGRTRSRDPWPELTQIDPNAPHVSYGGTWVMLDNHDLLSLSWDLDHLPFQPKLFPNFNRYAVNWQLLVTHPYLIIKLRTLGSKIWNAPVGSAEELAFRALDTVPLEAWMDLEAKGLSYPEHAKQAVRDWCFQAENFPQRPEHLWHMSTWYLARTIYIRLSHIAQTGVLMPKIMRWENGTGEIITRLVGKIRALGGYCYTEQKVTGFVTKDDHVEVNLKVGAMQTPVTYRARRVVYAGAPSAMRDVSFEPDPLPANYSNFANGLRQWDDTGTQVVLAWKKRWWDDKYLSVVMLPPPDDEQMGVYGATMDLSDHGPHDTKNYHHENDHPLPTGVGVLRILVKSIRLKNPDGSMWSTKQCKDSAFAYFAKFGHFKPADLEKDFLTCWVWNHEWNPDTLSTAFYGAPLGLYANAIPDCSKQWGRMHFAGSERSPLGVQWMEGAIHIAQRQTALEVLKELYPQQWTAEQRTSYKSRISHSEDQAMALLRLTHTHHPIMYVFEMVGRWAVGAVKNAFRWWREYRQLHWNEPPPKRPDGARSQLATVVGGQTDFILQTDYLYSPEGKFRLDIVDPGKLVLQHLHVNKIDAQWDSGAPSAPVPGPYKLVLQQTGDLQLLSADLNQSAVVWHTNTATPAGLYVAFLFCMGDNRGMNVYGQYSDGSRQVIWSSGTWNPHFARPSLREEAQKFEAELESLAMLANTRRAYRRPMNLEEEEIEKEMFIQQCKEKEYGRMFATVPERTGSESDRLRQGQVLREGQYLLSPHGRHCLSVTGGDLVLTHKKPGIHLLEPWEEIWRLHKPGPNATLSINDFGQLELCHGAEIAWQSDKPAKYRPQYRLHIQDDCNAALYDSHLKPVWTSLTAREPDVPEEHLHDEH